MADIFNLNNNQVATVVNAAMGQSTGKDDVEELDLRGIVDTGGDESVIGSRDSFTKALLNELINKWYTDSSYRSEFEDPFFVNTEKFGAIVQAISVEVPEVKESSAWQDFGPGEGQVNKVGEYTIYLPIVHNVIYGKSVSYELPVCVTEEQWNTAFKSESEFRGFVSYILMCVDNALIVHLENISNMNRNNFMAEKIAYAASVGATGVHVVDLVEKYVKEMGDPTADFSVEEYLSDVNAMRHGSEKIRLYDKYIGRMSVKYNTAGRKRFTPKERKVLQILSFFDERMKTVALSDTIHDDYVKLAPEGYQSVPFWQGQGEDDDDFDEISKIDIDIASEGTKTNITQSGIVAFLCDKWAILHTIQSRRVAVKHFDPEALTQYYYQYKDKYMNDLSMNAIVFILKDYTAPTP